MRRALPFQIDVGPKAVRFTKGAGLALATILAILGALAWHVANGRHASGSLDAALIEAGLDFVRIVRLSLSDGILGWVLDVLLSKILPLLILGSMLVSLTSLGRPAGSRVVEQTAERLTATLQAVFRLLLPTLVLGSLFMAERPGVDLVTMVLAWLLPLSVCLAWSWFMAVAPQETSEPATAKDALLIGGTIFALASALTAGLSLQLSAIIATGVMITLSFLDADIRERPNIILVALGQSGIVFGRVLVAAVAAGLILTVLDRTGLPIDIARLLAAAAGEAKLPLLVLAVMIAAVMGQVIPAFAAYLIVAALLGPALRTVGVADSATHALILVVTAVTVTIGYQARPRAE